MKKLNCGCEIDTCICDPMRHWPPVCCKNCPSLIKAENTYHQSKFELDKYHQGYWRQCKECFPKKEADNHVKS